MAMDRLEFAKIRKHWHGFLSPTIRKYGWKAPYFNVFFADRTLFSDGEHAFSFFDSKRAVTIECSDAFKAWLGTFDEEESLVDILYISGPTNLDSTVRAMDLINEWLIKKIPVGKMQLLLETEKYADSRNF